MATEHRTIPAVNPGTALKFRIGTTKDDFTLAGDKWNIVIKNKFGRTMWRITKRDCYYDTVGRWYFNIKNPQVGTYTAIFIGAYEDEDYDEQQRIWTDRQVLFVCREGCMMRQRRQRHPAACPVQYEQVWSCSINGEDYLAGSDGKYILTSDGKRIAFKNDKRKQIEDMGKVILDTMTGEEFKQFIEGRNPDGRIDTLPEMLDAAQGISDTETIQEDVNQQIQDEAGMTYEGDTRTLYINGAKPKPKDGE